MKSTIMLLLSFLVTGCVTKGIEEKQRDFKNTIEEYVDNSKTSHVIRAKKVKSTEKDLFFVGTDWKVNQMSIPASVRDNLYVLNSGELMTIPEFAQKLSFITGAKFELSPEITNTQANNSLEKASIAASSSQSNQIYNFGKSGSQSNNKEDKEIRIRPMYVNEPITKILDNLTTQVSIFWKYDKGRFFLYKYDTETYEIFAQSQSNESTAVVSNEGTSGGSDNSSGSLTNQKTVMKTKNDIFASLELSLKSFIVEPESFQMLPETNSIIVTGSKTTHDKIRNIVDVLNEKIDKAVYLNVTILKLHVEKKDDIGVSASIIYDTVRQSNISFNAVIPDLNNAHSLTIRDNYDQFNQSEAVVKAISKKGNVTGKYSTDLLIDNNKTATIHGGNLRDFLEKTNVQSTASVGSQAGAELETTVLGHTIHVTPTIHSNGKVSISFIFDNKDLLSIDPISSNGSILQAKNLSSQNLLTTTTINEGETTIFAIKEVNLTNNENSGIGTSFLGGVNEKSLEKDIYIFLATPHVKI